MHWNLLRQFAMSVWSKFPHFGGLLWNVQHPLHTDKGWSSEKNSLLDEADCKTLIVNTFHRSYIMLTCLTSLKYSFIRNSMYYCLIIVTIARNVSCHSVTQNFTLPSQHSVISLPILQDTQEHFGTDKIERI